MSYLFDKAGFLRFPFDAAVADWAKAAIGPALGIAADPIQRETWLRGKGTWFVGVDALGNDRSGTIDGVPLKGAVFGQIASMGMTPEAWHRAQVSVVYDGYPQAVEGESASAARYRLTRDAAHVDGLLPVGPARRRMLREPHAFVLGLPLNAVPKGASPLVVWRGSHLIMGRAFADVLSGHDPSEWPGVDLTDAYQAARRVCFATCERIEIAAQPGEATLLHRHLLHGVAPWSAPVFPEGRAIAYFRPEVAAVSDWL